MINAIYSKEKIKMNYNQIIKTTKREPTRKSGTVLMRAFAIFSLFMVLLQTVGTGQAANQYAPLNDFCFSYPTTAMSAYDHSIQNNLYRKTHSKVYHRSGATGSILLYGPADNIGTGATRFNVTFKDPDGPGLNSRVIAHLRHVGPKGIKVIASLDSNRESQVTNDVQTMTTIFSRSDNNETTGFYEVRVYIYRNTTTVSPSAYGYSFCNTIL